MLKCFALFLKKKKVPSFTRIWKLQKKIVGAAVETIMMWEWAGLAPLFLLAWDCGMWWKFTPVTRRVMRWHLTSKVESHHQNIPELVECHWKCHSLIVVLQSLRCLTACWACSEAVAWSALSQHGFVPAGITCDLPTVLSG